MFHQSILASLFTSLVIILMPSLIRAQDAELIVILKSQEYYQSSDINVDPEVEPFIFEVYVQASGADSINSVTLTPPTGPDIAIPEEVGGTEFFRDEKFTSKAAFDAAYPNDAYSLKIDGANDGMKTVDLDFMDTDAYLPAPRFIGYDAAQALEHDMENTLTWAPITGAGTDDWMFLEIEDSNENLVFESPFPGEPGSLDGESTSIDIPSGTLEFNKAYTVRISVIRRVDTSGGYPGADAFAAFQTSTYLGIRTMGPDLDPPTLNRSAPSYGQEEVTLNSVVTFVFSEPMDTGVSPGNAINWTGLPDPNAITYTWSTDQRFLFCAYPGGLPVDTIVTWALNPLGSLGKLRDTVGNELVSPGEQGEFHTSASSNVGSPDANNIEFFKAQSFSQAGDTLVATGEYFVDLYVNFSGISTVRSVDLNVPGRGNLTGIGEFEFGFEGLEAEDSSLDPDELNANYPDGNYGVVLHTVNDGDKNLTLNPGTGDYPAAPIILNFSTTQDWDSTQPFTISWNLMEGGTLDDVIFFYIEGDNDEYFNAPGIGEPHALTGQSTSITIPANTLPPGRTLQAEIAFARINTNDTAQYPGARIVSGIASLTSFTIQTAGSPYVPKVSVEHDGTMATVKVTGERGQIYDLYSSENLVDWGYVTTLYLFDDRDGFLSSASYQDGLSNGLPKNFYQLENAGGE